MKNSIHIIIFLTLSFLSCNEIFEEDVTKESVVLIAPANGIETDLQNIGFLWEELPDVESYRFQLAVPNFTVPVTVLIDSLVNKNSFQITLAPGNYEWRVRAENSAYFSDYTIHGFKIDSLLNPINQIINLISPRDSFLTQSGLIDFEWSNLVGIIDYQFQIEKQGILVIDTIALNNSMTYNLTEEDSYSWKVLAFNDLGQSGFSERKLIIDNTPPVSPQLNNPSDGALIFADSVNLSWSVSNDRIRDSLFVFRFVSGSPLDGFPKSLESTNFMLKGESGAFEWYVKSVDEAGNVSQASNLRIFTLNP